MDATITIGGLTFHSQPHPSGLYFRRLIDWYSLPQAKERPDARPRAHGSFAREFDYREAAAPGFEARYVGSSRADALAMMQRITGVLARPGLVMTVTDELGSTSRRVSVQNARMPDLRGDSTFAFPVDMTAPDPLRYGSEVSSSTGPPVAGGGISWPLTWPLTWAAGGSEGRLVISNAGEEETFSRFAVDGGVTGGFSIAEVGTGREIRLERLIPQGSRVFLDQRTGAVYLDDPGNDLSGFLTRADWFPIPAGGQATVQFNILGTPSGSPTLTHWTSPAFW